MENEWSPSSCGLQMSEKVPEKRLPYHPTMAGLHRTPEFPRPRDFPAARCSRQHSPTAGSRARSGCQRLGMRRVALTFCRPQTIILHLAKIQTRLVTLLGREAGRAGRKGFALPDGARVALGTLQGSPTLVPSGDRAGAQ